jgi:hypothetical protein
LEILLLLLLLIGAGAILLPDILRERALDSPVNTISDFRRGMTALAISTHNYKPAKGGYYLSGYQNTDPEPYIRHSYYPEGETNYEQQDFVPYPTNRAKAEMETRRNRIIASLLVVCLGTGILALIPKLRWIIPVHLVMLLVLAIYIGLVILLPHYERQR